MVVYQSRMRAMIYFVVIVSLFFFSRLLYLQVLTNKYKKFAENNALQHRVIYPPRGLIFDRNGRLLVSNEVVYDLMVIPSQVKAIDTAEFCRLLQIKQEDFINLMLDAKENYAYRPSVFIKNLSISTYGTLQERLYEFRGFYVQPRTIRKYPYSSLAHVLGYIGEVNENQVIKSDGYYHRGDYIGVSGLEEYYEKELRGTIGLKYILVDAFNNEQGSYEDGDMDKQSEPGSNLQCTIDLDLQAYAEKLMQNKKGSVVAIIPKTGEILVMASSPSYNPSLLTGRERSAHYRQLLEDADKPLFNRAASAMYPPGSTFKIIMASIGLEEGVLHSNTYYACNGGYYVANLRIGCHIHPSPLDMHNAIVLSCNTYFCYVFRSIIDQRRFGSTERSYNDWKYRVSDFGVGKKLGLDLYAESPGILPSSAHYDKIYGRNRWYSSNILSLAIGQAEISLTPLQLTNVAATVANRGYYIQPHLVRSVEKDGKNINLSFKKNSVNVSKDDMDLIADAMYDVVNKGTGYTAFVDNLFICGKTGTAQNPHGKDHSIFIAFAPKDDPKIAIAVIIENAGFGATWAAPLGSLIIQKYLSDSIPANRAWLEKIITDFNFISPVSKSIKTDTTRHAQE